jgi:hypothetical protein
MNAVTVPRYTEALARSKPARAYTKTPSMTGTYFMSTIFFRSVTSFAVIRYR